MKKNANTTKKKGRNPTPEDAAKMVQDAARCSQDALSTRQDTPKKHQDAPNMLNITPRCAQDASKTAKMFPRCARKSQGERSERRERSVVKVLRSKSIPNSFCQRELCMFSKAQGAYPKTSQKISNGFLNNALLVPSDRFFFAPGSTFSTFFAF